MPTMTRKPKKSRPEAQGRARDRGDTRLVTFELNAALDQALEEQSKRERRSKKAVLTLALEVYLARKGAWTLPEGTEGMGPLSPAD